MTRAIWLSDYHKVSTALENGGWILDLDGLKFIDTDAPADLVNIYDRLRSIGYANRWL